MDKKKNHKNMLIIIIIIAVVLDQIIKFIAYRQGWNITTNQIYNEDNNGYYIIMSLIIILMIIRYISNDNTFIKLDTKIILSLAISGAIGNLIDRIWNKQVIVFIDIGKNFHLNLSYIYIIIAWIGMAMILTKNSMNIVRDIKKRKKG